MVSQTEVSRFICRSGEHKNDYYLICIKDGRLETQIIKKEFIQKFGDNYKVEMVDEIIKKLK
ncbi:MAG: hypothetical protein PHS54_07605 [Clostridia bacterium]|nr:hypothetical protein [Clostridia bacterium]